MSKDSQKYIEIKNKICNTCREVKDISCFNKSKCQKDGFDKRCRECNRGYYLKNRDKILKQKKEYHIKNKEKISEYNRKYNIENKEKLTEYRRENRDRDSKRGKIYREENRDELRKKYKIYDEKNKDRKKEYREDRKEIKKEYDKQYYLKNKEKAYEKQRKRRAMKIGVNESFTSKDKRIIMNIFNKRCFNCGSTDRLSIDHHYPLSEGNPLTTTNAVVLCKTCNATKATKKPEDFYTKEKLEDLERIFEITKEQEMPKRNLFEELVEGIEAMAEHRKGNLKTKENNNE